MTEAFFGLLLLALIAGGGIILIDAFVIRRIRSQAAPPSPEPDPSDKPGDSSRT